MRLRETDLKKLNSATKYPSILTYHEMGDKGRLVDHVQVSFSDYSTLLVTEKIDGTNVRIIVFPDGEYVIGSREDLLHAHGDMIFNPAMGIVEGVRAVADRIIPYQEGVRVLYGEFYGHKVTAAAKAYTGSGATGFRLFDMLEMHMDEFAELNRNEVERIAQWRDEGGQLFCGEDGLRMFADACKIDIAPRIFTAQMLPSTLEETALWLAKVVSGGTYAALDLQAKGRPEGVVVRTPGRTKIAKIRFEDYERTLRKK